MQKHFEIYNIHAVKRARGLRRRSTDAEVRLWRYVRNNGLGVKVRRQVPIGSYVLDFYCPKAKLCIELDGGQHFTLLGQTNDARRDAYLLSLGIKTLRVSDRDVLLATYEVVQTIFEEIGKRLVALSGETPSSILPSPRRVVDLRGEGGG